MSHPTGQARAFTLFEVLLALALVGVLAGAVFGFAWALQDRRDAILRAGRDGQAGDTLIDRLETDLIGAVVGDRKLGAGVAGTESELRLVCRGVNLGVEDAAAASDLVRVTYLHDPASGVLRAEREPVTATGEATPPREISQPDALSERVARLAFRYFDGREWRSTFDSLRSGTLPAALEVAVWFGEPAREGAPGPDRRWSQPDRLWVFVVPDGPGAAWGARR